MSALYIITSDDELRCKCLPFVDNEGIDFNEILEKQDFSGGYNPLIRLASNLFNENYGVTPMELITKTDDERFRIALEAIVLRRSNGPFTESNL